MLPITIFEKNIFNTLLYHWALIFTFFFYRTILIANNIKVMTKEITPNFSADDLMKIKKFARSKDQVCFTSWMIYNLDNVSKFYL